MYIKADVTDLFNEDTSVKLELAKNPNTRPALLTRLAGDYNQQVRLMVSFNPNTPAETLDKLSKEYDLYIRRGVAENANTSPATLEYLFSCGNDFVNVGVGGNPNTPENILYDLYATFGNLHNPNSDEYLLSSLLHNPALPEDLRGYVLEEWENFVSGFKHPDEFHSLVQVWFTSDELPSDFDSLELKQIVERIISRAGYTVYTSWFETDPDADPDFGEFPDQLVLECDLISCHRDSRKIENQIYSELKALGLTDIGYNDEERPG